VTGGVLVSLFSLTLMLGTWKHHQAKDICKRYLWSHLRNLQSIAGSDASIGN